MELTIITPDETLFQGEAKLVQLPGSDGSFELLDRHAPIISTLSTGNIRVLTSGGETMELPVKTGVVEMSGNKVSILAEKQDA